MYIARLSLIALFAFTFVIGCSMVGQQDDATMTKDADKTSETSVSTAKKPTYQEVTFNVEGMT